MRRAGESPDHERLFERRLKDLVLAQVPAGALFVTGAADVQHNRLEWCVYAWGVGFTRWLVDKGIIEGDPNMPDVWRRLDEVRSRRYRDWRGEYWQIDAFGCDAGYLSTKVYAWALRHAGTGRVFALDGRDGWRLPPLGSPSKIDVDFDGRKAGTVLLWPVGTWDMKSELYAACRNLISGPDPESHWPIGTIFFGENVDREWLKQLTCEYLKDTPTRDGHTVKGWFKPQGVQNEAHDLAVYNAALAHHLADRLSPDEWAALAAEKKAPLERIQGDLEKFWGATLVAQVPPDAPSTAVTAPASAEDGASRGDWLDTGGDWLGDRRDRDWLN